MCRRSYITFCLSRRYQSDIVAHRVFNDLLRCALSASCVPHTLLTWDIGYLQPSYFPGCRRVHQQYSGSCDFMLRLTFVLQCWSNSATLITQPQGSEGQGFCFNPIMTETPELSYSVDFFLFLSFSWWKKWWRWSLFGVQMIQQLFELEMCMRETKNRTCTPLSQLPLRCLWDCLYISPLSSFSPPALLLFSELSLPLSHYFPTFSWCPIQT